MIGCGCQDGWGFSAGSRACRLGRFLRLPNRAYLSFLRPGRTASCALAAAAVGAAAAALLRNIQVQDTSEKPGMAEAAAHQAKGIPSFNFWRRASRSFAKSGLEVLAVLEVRLHIIQKALRQGRMVQQVGTPALEVMLLRRAVHMEMEPERKRAEQEERRQKRERAVLLAAKA